MVSARSLALGASLVAVLAGTGCGLDGELFGLATERGHVVLPQPSDTILTGRATTVGGGTVTLTTAGGGALAEHGVSVDADGFFSLRFGGTEGYLGLMVWGHEGDRSVVGALPELPRQPTVFHEEHALNLWDVHASLADLNASTTTVAFVAARAASNAGVSLDALSAPAISRGLDQVVTALADTTGAVYSFAQLVALIDVQATASATGHPVFEPGAISDPARSLLSLPWLLAVGLDLDGDGVADTTTQVFDDALAAAAASVAFGVCYAPDEIAVVWHLDLRADTKNSNCSLVDTYRWATPAPGKQVFIAAGVHEDTPVCGPSVPTHCLDEATVDTINAQMGGWVPNVTPMYDDGSHGDAVAGDGIWSLQMVLPYWPAAESVTGAGVRLAYKYTLGLPGQGWTGAEEWPGNQRLLELVDLNGDHIITRYDIFGDEAANKDKVNALKPVFGGCGFVSWEAERDPTCVGDSRENQVDIDGDCVADGFDDPRPVVPVTVECP